MADTRDELLDAIRKAAARQGGPYLSYEQFKLISDIPISRVFRHFDSWNQACHAANVRPGENSPSNLVPNYSKGKEHALEQLKRVAQILQTDVVSKADFDAHATELRSATVQRMFKGWENALRAAGLQRHPFHQAPIPLDHLAAEFLAATRELGSVPTIVQMCRRSKHAKNTFTRKFGTYSQFKRQVSELLLVNETGLSTDERAILETELGALPQPASASVIDLLPTSPTNLK